MLPLSSFQLTTMFVWVGLGVTFSVFILMGNQTSDLIMGLVGLIIHSLGVL